jgi:hypothetical protein
MAAVLCRSDDRERRLAAELIMALAVSAGAWLRRRTARRTDVLVTSTPDYKMMLGLRMH